MEEKRILIYTCELYIPYLTPDFQENACHKKLLLDGIEGNITVISDVLDSKVNLEKVMHKINFYDIIVIYSLSVLGKSYLKIIDTIERILDKKVQLVSFAEPVDLTTFGKLASEKLVLTTAIGFAVYGNDIWKTIKKMEN